MAALGLNLRADLAKLSDEELAARLEVLCSALDEARRNQRRSWSVPLFSFRGPIRHPRAYRFLWLMQDPSDFVLAHVFAAFVFSSKRYENYFNPPAAHLHLTTCELKDIADEIKRRIAYRKANVT